MSFGRCAARRCLTTLIFVLAACIAGRGQTTTGLDTTAASDSTSAEISHLALTIDATALAEDTFEGRAVYELTAAGDSIESLHVRSADLNIQQVVLSIPDTTIDDAEYHQPGSDSLIVPVNSRVPPDSTIRLDIRYTGRSGPGIQTQIGPDGRLLAAWTSGVEGTNRFWFPTFERPTDPFTLDLRVTVPSPLRVVSAGTKISTTTTNGGETFHMQLDHAWPAHLIGFAAGSYESVRGSVDAGTNGSSVILEYLVPPEHIGDARRSFGATPGAMQFFANYLEEPYPWPIYRQAVIPGIRPGSQQPPMTGLMADSMLVDRRAKIDYPGHVVVAQTLANQWTGVILTAESGSDRWIQKGLSVFLATRYLERSRGTDDALLELGRQEQRYISRRDTAASPLAPHDSVDTRGMLARASAIKGAWVFRMLRQKLGEESFVRALRSFVDEHRHESVSTEDLTAAFQSVADQPLYQFFDEWIYGAGHPELHVSYGFNPSVDSLSVHLEQTQSGPGIPPAFALELRSRVYGLMGSTDTSFTVTDRNQISRIPLSGDPRFVEFDPANQILDSLNVEQSAAAWIRQLNEGQTVHSRLRAARAAAAYAEDPSLTIGLKGALNGSPHPAVHAAVIRTMGSLPPSGTISSTIREAASNSQPAIRRAALYALRTSRNPERARSIAMKAAQNDTSYSVQAAAVRTLAALGGDNAFSVIQSAFVTASHNEIIRRAAFDALSILDPPLSRSLPVALKWSAPSVPAAVRAAAPDYLAHHLENAQVRRRLGELLADKDVRVRTAAVEALAEVSSGPAADLLEQRLQNERHPWIRSGIRAAVRGTK